jgi:fructose-1,6-bisphosphatase
MANPWAKLSMITLDRYLRTGQRIDPGLILALEQAALAVKRISNELAGAALKGELGYSGAINVQGEEVEKLDTWSDNVFVDTFSGAGRYAR